MTKEEFIEQNCRLCDSQRCLSDNESIGACEKYKGDIDGIAKTQTLAELIEEIHALRVQKRKEMEAPKDANEGLKCCAEFLCRQCPYFVYDHPEFKMRCIHRLIVDLNDLYNK